MGRALVEKNASNSAEPKRNLNPYFHFMAEVKKNIADGIDKGYPVPRKGAGSVMKIAGAAWRNLPAHEKAKWVKLAADDLKRYEREMAEYEKTGSY